MPPGTKCFFERPTATRNKSPNIEVLGIVLNFYWNEQGYTLPGDIGKPFHTSLNCGAIICQKQTQTKKHHLPSSMHMSYMCVVLLYFTARAVETLKEQKRKTQRNSNRLSLTLHTGYKNLFVCDSETLQRVCAFTV